MHHMSVIRGVAGPWESFWKPFLCRWKELCVSGGPYLITRNPHALLEGFAHFKMNINLNRLHYPRRRGRRWWHLMIPMTCERRWHFILVNVLLYFLVMFLVWHMCLRVCVWGGGDHTGLMMLSERRLGKQLRGVTGGDEARRGREEVVEDSYTGLFIILMMRLICFMV